MAEEKPATTSKGQAKKDAETLRDIATRAYPDNPDKVDQIVDQTMTKLGHKRRVEYDDAEPEGEEEEGTEEEEESDAWDEEEEPPSGPKRQGRSYWRTKANA